MTSREPTADSQLTTMRVDTRKPSSTATKCGQNSAFVRPPACIGPFGMASSPSVHRLFRSHQHAVDMAHKTDSYFHLHLISDATGETLTTVARAATAQYTKVMPVEHVYPLVRTQKQLDRVLAEIE